MASLQEFSRRIKVRAAKVVTNTDKLVRSVALAADQAIVSGTPVDTGRARSNWIVQLDSASDSVIEAYAPGKKGVTAAANTQAAIDQGEAVIHNYQSGKEIHITNNLPYIQELNDGSSKQAPANFVESAVQAAVAKINAARIID